MRKRKDRYVNGVASASFRTRVPRRAHTRANVGARLCARVRYRAHLKAAPFFSLFFFCAFSYRCLIPLCTSDARRRRRLFLPCTCSNPHWCNAGPAISCSSTTVCTVAATIFRSNIYDILLISVASAASAASGIRRSCRRGRGYDGLYLPSPWLHLHYFLPTVYHRLSDAHSCILYVHSRPIFREEEQEERRIHSDDDVM